METVIAAVEELLLKSRISEIAKQLEVQVVFPRTIEEAMDLMLQRKSARLIVDMEIVRLKPADLIRAVRSRPELNGATIIAYYPHAQGTLKQEALAAGCNRAMARSEFSRLLPDLMQPNLVKEEWRAVRNGAGLVDLSSRERIEVRGKDRIGFLHGLTTNDVKNLGVGRMQESTIVTRQGKMVAVMNILAFEKFFLLEMEPGLSSIVRQMLTTYIVTDDVQLEGSNRTAIALHGPRSSDILRELFKSDHGAMAQRTVKTGSFRGSEIWIARVDSYGPPGFELIPPHDAMAALAEACVAAGARRIGAETAEVLRIENGIPKWEVDITSDMLPMEAGLEDRAISYSKGCYLGQEVIQRVKTYGEPPRKLIGLVVEGSVIPKRDDSVSIGGQKIGRITSAIHSIELDRPIALAIVDKAHKTPGAEVNIESGEVLLRATTTMLPFINKS